MFAFHPKNSGSWENGNLIGVVSCALHDTDLCLRDLRNRKSAVVAILVRTRARTRGAVGLRGTSSHGT